jgi:hypothetical protein
MEEKKILRNENCPQKRAELIVTGETVSVLRGVASPLYEYRLDCYDDAIRLDKPIVKIFFSSKDKQEFVTETEKFEKSHVNFMLEKFWGDYLEMSPDSFIKEKENKSGYTVINEIDSGSSVQIILGDRLLFNKPNSSSNNEFGKHFLYLKSSEANGKRGYIGIRLFFWINASIKSLLNVGDDEKKIEEALGGCSVEGLVLKGDTKMFLNRENGASVEYMHLKNLDLDKVYRLIDLLPPVERFLLGVPGAESGRKYDFSIYEDGEWGLRDNTGCNKVYRLSDVV